MQHGQASSFVAAASNGGDILKFKLTHYGWHSLGQPSYVVGMSPVLTDEQTEALVQLLLRTIQDDRHPLSPRIVTLKEILGVLRPEPEREPLPRGSAANKRTAGTIAYAMCRNGSADLWPWSLLILHKSSVRTVAPSAAVESKTR